MSGAFGADRSSLGQVPLRDRHAERHVPTSLRIGTPAGLVRHFDPEVKAAWEDALSVIFPDSPITMVEVPIDESRDIVGTLYRLGCAYAVSQIPEGRRADLHFDLLQFIEPSTLKQRARWNWPKTGGILKTP
jgi:aspartyl-tRNA(Asn)/glutamyl-tRNA(Gln) amidotransferase subunit A